MSGGRQDGGRRGEAQRRRRAASCDEGGPSSACARRFDLSPRCDDGPAAELQQREPGGPVARRPRGRPPRSLAAVPGRGHEVSVLGGSLRKRGGPGAGGPAGTRKFAGRPGLRAVQGIAQARAQATGGRGRAGRGTLHIFFAARRPRPDALPAICPCTPWPRRLLFPAIAAANLLQCWLGCFLLPQAVSLQPGHAATPPRAWAVQSAGGMLWLAWAVWAAPLPFR